MDSRVKSVDNLHPLILNVGLALQNGNWNWRKVNSPFARLYYVTRGKAKVELPTGTMELTPCHLYMIPAFTTHSYVCDGVFEHYYIHIYEDNGVAAGFLEEYTLPLEVEAGTFEEGLCRRLCELNPAMALVNTDPRTYDNDRKLMDNIMRNKQRTISNKIESRGILYLLLAKFFHEATPKKEMVDPRIAKSIKYIQEHLYGTISVEVLTKVACVSKDHFIRLFKHFTGLSPTQYINRKKIERALILLVAQNDSVKGIAFRLGYKDYSYFIRLFRKYTGTTPQEYRNQHREQSEANMSIKSCNLPL